MKPKYKPCPFCGCEEVDVYETDSGVGGLRGEFYCMCDGCFAHTCTSDSKTEAKALWNRRVKAAKVVKLDKPKG